MREILDSPSTAAGGKTSLLQCPDVPIGVLYGGLLHKNHPNHPKGTVPFHGNDMFLFASEVAKPRPLLKNGHFDPEKCSNQHLTFSLEQLAQGKGRKLSLSGRVFLQKDAEKALAFQRFRRGSGFDGGCGYLFAGLTTELLVCCQRNFYACFWVIVTNSIEFPG